MLDFLSDISSELLGTKKKSHFNTTATMLEEQAFQKTRKLKPSKN